MPELAQTFVGEFALAHFVVLSRTFDVWRFYFKMEVPNFKLFCSQNSDLDNEQLDKN